MISLSTKGQKEIIEPRFGQNELAATHPPKSMRALKKSSRSSR